MEDPSCSTLEVLDSDIDLWEVLLCKILRSLFWLTLRKEGLMS